MEVKVGVSGILEIVLRDFNQQPLGMMVALSWVSGGRDADTRKC